MEQRIRQAKLLVKYINDVQVASYGASFKTTG